MTWQPIETAPKDRAFLGYQRLSKETWIVAPMYWSNGHWLIMQFHSDNSEHSMNPTHWQEVPLPPEGDE